MDVKKARSHENIIDTNKENSSCLSQNQDKIEQVELKQYGLEEDDKKWKQKVEEDNKKARRQLQRSNSYLKYNPSHFNHGEKTLKGCILCEGKHKHKHAKEDNYVQQRGEEKKNPTSINLQKAETQSNVPNAPSLIDTSEF